MHPIINETNPFQARREYIMQSFARETKVHQQNELDPIREIGMALREARENKLLTINDVKEITCIPAQHIVAIEEGDVRKLPEDPFLMGFIRRYARVLGLDEYYLCNAYMNSKKNHMHKPKERKADEFDLLFDGNSKPLSFQTEDKKSGDRVYDGKFFKVSHFYSALVFFMLVTACYLVVQITINNPENERYKTAVSHIEDLDRMETVAEVPESVLIPEEQKKSIISENKPVADDVPDVQFASDSAKKPVKSVVKKANPVISKKVQITKMK